MGKTIIKGKHLSYLSDNYSCIEVRVCVATSEHYFADYPHYNHINQVDTLSRYYKKLDQQKGYRFGIGFWNVCKGLEITINDMIIMNDRTQLSNFKSPLTDWHIYSYLFYLCSIIQYVSSFFILNISFTKSLFNIYKCEADYCMRIIKRMNICML